MGKFAARSLVLSLDGDTVGQILSGLEGIGSSRDLIDASAYGDDWKDYVSGQQDGSELDLTIAYDPADSAQGAIKDLYDSGDEGTFEVEQESSGLAITFPALVTECMRGGARDGLLEMSVKLKILNPGVTDIES